MCVDFLVKLGTRRPNDLLIVLNPPDELRLLFTADGMGLLIIAAISLFFFSLIFFSCNQKKKICTYVLKKRYVHMNLNYLLGFVNAIVHRAIFVYPKTLGAQVEEAWVSFLSCYV